MPITLLADAFELQNEFYRTHVIERNVEVKQVVKHTFFDSLAKHTHPYMECLFLTPLQGCQVSVYPLRNPKQKGCCDEQSRTHRDCEIRDYPKNRKDDAYCILCICEGNRDEIVSTIARLIQNDTVSNAATSNAKTA